MRLPTEWSYSLRAYIKLGDHPQVIARARELWAEALSLCELQQWRKIVDRQEFEDSFAPYSLSSRALQKLLIDCERVALLAVSIGEALEQKVRCYMDHQRPMEGYLLDRMGSFMAESAMRQFDRHLQRESDARGWHTTRRFSPGYRDFNIEAQVPFVALIGKQWPGLRLTAGGLLLPEKTITAIKGILPAKARKTANERNE